MQITEYIKRVQSGSIAFKSLPSKARTEIIGTLKSNGMLSVEIMEHMRVDRGLFYYHLNRYYRGIAEQIKSSAPQFIGRLVSKAEVLYKLAKNEKDYNLSWKIETDLMELLMKLGWIDAKPDPAAVNVFINADTKAVEAELANDLTLLERIKSRAENPKLAEFAVTSNGNGTARHAGEPGVSEGSSERSAEREDETGAGSAG